MTFTSCTPVSLISMAPCICCLPSHTSQKRKIKAKQNKKKQNKGSMETISHCGNSSVTVCLTVCPIVYPSFHTSSLANIHYNETLDWSKASGFCHTVNIGCSLGLLLAILLLLSVMEILQHWIRRTRPFIQYNRSQVM